MANEQVKAFIAQIAPLIVAEGKARGYRIFSTVIAQAIIESRYGQSTLGSKYHNYFGLKAGAAWVLAGKPNVVLKTKEEYKVGVLTTIKDAFRVYTDMAAGVAGYYDFINTKRYKNLKDAVTYIQYAQFLKADGYATSSSYISTLCKTVEQYDLIDYDTCGSVPPMYVIGQEYTTLQDLNVRREPNGELLPFDELTEDGKRHGMPAAGCTAILKRNTRVTVKDICDTGTCVWLKIPSGWICGKNSKNIFVI